ncbi:Scn3b [Columba guinea]|nr:Scn3b [Columba guinea]
MGCPAGRCVQLKGQELMLSDGCEFPCLAGFCCAVCVEVPSETEAVQGKSMKLLCISCMKREEVTASTMVEWFYRPEGGKDELIYKYRKMNHEFQSRFSGRIQWNGSKDMQDVSITVLNVTLNDSGTYTCNITREFEFEIHRPLFTSSRQIHLTVVEEAGEDFTSVISEIMMYILLVFLTLWLLIEMVYCYRKVSKAEEAAQENANSGGTNCNSRFSVTDHGIDTHSDFQCLMELETTDELQLHRVHKGTCSWLPPAVQKVEKVALNKMEIEGLTSPHLPGWTYGNPSGGLLSRCGIVLYGIDGDRQNLSALKPARRGALKVTEKLQYPEHSPGDLLPTATSEDGPTGTLPRGHT